jgi:hypothetical protein
MRLSASAIILIFIPFLNFAQSGDYRMGGRSMGMGFASTTVTDEWSAFHNIGSMAGKIQLPSVCFAYQSVYSVEGLGKSAAGITLPVNNFCGSVNFFRFGDQYFNETRVGLGISHKIRFVSLGFQVNYLQLAIENFGNRGIIYFDAGGLAEIIPGLWVGAFIQNLSRAKVSKLTGEEFPVLMGLGISYRPGDFILLNVDIEKNSLNHSLFKAGLEYSIHHKLYLRTGFGLNPAKNYFGIGFSPYRFKIDYALAIQGRLGVCHEFSLCYNLKKKK